jgi:hypothetical protein
MSSTLAELEAACVAGWDREQLAVYADALQAANDPRGELIAIDLHAEANRATTALDERRKQLLVEWLGEDVAAAVRCVWGFLELRPSYDTPEDPDLLAKLLGGPGGAYLRGLELWGSASFIESTLLLVALNPRLRLAGLAIHQTPGRRSHALAGKLAADLIRATPALETLVLRGSKVFGAFSHPKLRRVRVAGWDALGSLAGIGGPLPALEELDFATSSEFVLNAYGIAELDRLLRGVPALRRLDLSRNEPSDQPWARTVDLFKFLRELALKRKLTHLRVPSLRTPGDVVNLQASIDRMPDLVELEVTRVFEAPPGTPQPRLELFHPAKIILPRDSPWGPRTHSRGRDAIEIEIPGHPYPLVAELLDAVKLMESSYVVRSGRERDTLPTSSRTAWHHIWNALDRLGWDTGNRRASITIDAGLFVDALALPDDLLERRWARVRDALRARRSERGEILTIRRSWTY